MTTALVIGGTRGFGRAMSNCLSQQFEVQTVGRSEDATFQCDLSNPDQWGRTLEQISDPNLLVCVTGFAEPKKPSDLTNEDWERTHQLNFGYVLQALDKLNPERTITIGSRWSLRRDCPLLLPYIEAKHQLADFVRASDQDISCYCVPPMQTPGLAFVMDSLSKIADNGFTVDCHDIDEVARSIVQHNMENDTRNQVYLMNGEIKCIQQ